MKVKRRKIKYSSLSTAEKSVPRGVRRGAEVHESEIRSSHCEGPGCETFMESQKNETSSNTQ